MKQLIAVVLLCCFPLVALAEMKIIPPWEKKQCPTETFACYTFDQAKTLMTLDLDLQLRFEKCDACALDKAALTEATANLTKANALLDENAKILDKRLTERQVAYDAQADVVAKLASRDVFGKALPWVITVIVVAAAGGFVGGYVLGRK